MTEARSRTQQAIHQPRSLRRVAVSAAVALAISTTWLVGPAMARADEASTILRHCTAGTSLAGFSQAAYERALHDLATVLSEYSNCEELIRAAELAASGTGRGGSALGTGAGTPGAAAGSVAPPTSAEQAVLARAQTEGGAPVGLGSASVHPGLVKASIASALSTLPTPLLALLSLLMAMAVAGGVGALVSRGARSPRALGALLRNSAIRVLRR
ncbi:MAG: hypothetical protein ACYDA6_04080 [Solirubrobacteraceae bacterium]